MTDKFKFSLGAFKDGDWEDGDFLLPSKVNVSIPQSVAHSIIEGQKLVLSDPHVSSLEMHMPEISFDFLPDADEDPDDYIQMLGSGSVVVDATHMYFRVGTKHGYDYMMSQSIELHTLSSKLHSNEEAESEPEIGM